MLKQMIYLLHLSKGKIMKTYTMYTDPGHGWLKVHVDELRDFGIEDSISQYSYRRGDYAYLEEDCDLSLFVERYVDRHIARPKISVQHANRNSKIRSYRRYYATR